MRSETRPLVVIMARGASVRMGAPKGLLAVGPDGVTMGARIRRLYACTRWPVVMIVRHEDAVAYERDLGKWEGTLLVRPGGGDTGTTVKEAWCWAKREKRDTTHLWVHPVDLPLVAHATVRELKRLSDLLPDEALRPGFQGQPGHPVIFPCESLDMVMSTDPKNQSMAQVWFQAVSAGFVEPIRIHEVADPGIHRDFDTQESLRSVDPKDPRS